MLRYLEIGPEANRHTRATRFSDEWVTMGLSDKNEDLDVNADMDSPWPFDDDRFDVVFSSHVLEHSRYPWKFIREAYRVLKPGGVCRVNVPNARWLCTQYMKGESDLFNLMRNLRCHEGAPEQKAHWHPFDSATLVKLFETGFYQLLGGELEPPAGAHLFEDVGCYRISRSRLPLLKAKYFNTRGKRTLRCEGNKPGGSK